ncbi:ABC transporter ATP-binding protein [Candidatus Halobonum tyrrellensis]|uniref:Probable branched-chain amino acid transport ATP-binding protein LivG n=1 Tax=Candidatus Halobonum tyrrellensis G22 TaxID=1324957 RepID=V4IZW8_9EURY|nr:ABC-type branched-chain amino acid transport systems, ATP-binding protein I [Candidatus Halobonum tyrrellensis G22]
MTASSDVDATDETELDDADADERAADPDATGRPAEPLLEVDSLTKSFGGIDALNGVTFDVTAGMLTGLIGPNGAGKSTTFNVISGVFPPDSGTVRFGGEDVTGLAPNETASRGLVRTFQMAREFRNMTVLENLMVAPKAQVGETAWRSVLPGARGAVSDQEEEVFERAWSMLEFFDIDHLALENAGNLSGGQRKLLELARALMLDPEMLLLDEPFAGVNPSLESKLLERIETLRDRGQTFLLVEHDMDLIMEHCERVIVMHQGRTLVTGTPEEVQSQEEVVEAYLGGNVA